MKTENRTFGDSSPDRLAAGERIARAWLLAVAMIVLLVLPVAGCGGGDDFGDDMAEGMEEIEDEAKDASDEAGDEMDDIM